LPLPQAAETPFAHRTKKCLFQRARSVPAFQ